MKKYLLVLGMVLSLLGATACGTVEVKESTLTQADAEQLAKGYIGIVYDLAQQQVDMELYGEDAATYYGLDTEVLKSAVDNYSAAIEDLGSYKEITSVTFTEEDKEVVISAKITGSNTTSDGAPREAEVLLTFLKPKMKLESMLTNVEFTFAEMMTNAALNTVLGMGTVFAVLILLMACISCFKLVNNAEKAFAEKKANKEKAATAPTSVDNAVAQIEANEEAQDDTELIAVIAAAIAAAEGAASADGYVVRSIRRRY